MTKDLYVRVDDETYEALQELAIEDGGPLAQQVRRALRKYLHARGMTLGQRELTTAGSSRVREGS